MGQTEAEQVRIDIIENQVNDYNTIFYYLAYEKDDQTYEKKKQEFLNNLQVYLDQVSKFLGERQFVAGKNISYIDFALYEWLDKQKYYDSEAIKKHANLVEYQSRIEQLPTIKKYINSDKFLKWPLFYSTAKFGG